MPLDDEQIADLLGSYDNKRRVSLVDDVLRVDHIIRETQKQLKDAQMLRSRRILLAFEAGVPQTVIAEALHITRQRVASLIWEYRLRMGIPEGVTLLEHEAKSD